MPKLNKFNKEKNEEALLNISDPNAKKCIYGALRAIEGFICFSIITLGLLQMMSLKFSPEEEIFAWRYLRTRTNPTASEATIAYALRKSIFFIIDKYRNFPIMQIIRSKQHSPFLELPEETRKSA